MLKQYRVNEYAPKLYFAGLILLAAGLPLSKPVISIAEMILGLSWLISGEIVNKTKRFFTNPITLILVSFFLLHLLGLIYTNNFQYAFDNLRIKLPLLVLPLIIATANPISEKKLFQILWVFIFSVLAATLVSTGILLGIVHRHVNNIHDISIYNSHIRFALMICLSVFILIGLAYQEHRMNRTINWKILLLIFWEIIFLILLESVTGLLVLTIISLLLASYFILKSKNKTLRISLLLILLIIPSVLATYLAFEIRQLNIKYPMEFSALEPATTEGNLYENRINNPEYENGYPVWIYVSNVELEREWSKRSQYQYHGQDDRGQQVDHTLIRFMASKNLRKDALGLKEISDDEIRSVEKGIANVNYQGISNISARVKQIIWELKSFSEGGDPSGHSVAQRLEFWKASLEIIHQHPFIGVGTGDVEDAFAKEYDLMNSKLSLERRLTSHNQYLLAAVTFGILGLISFIFSLIYPLIKLNKQNDYYYIVFFLIVCLSMLTEDTLETQAGVTFFAFFNALFLFALRAPDSSLFDKSFQFSPPSVP